MKNMKKFLALLTLIVISSSALVNSVVAQYGSSSSSSSSTSNISTPSAPSCDNEKPGTPILFEPHHPLFGDEKKLGEVTLHWTKAERATSYNILYGLSPRNYIYSALQIGNGNTTTYSVAGLNPSKTYYFTVQANNGCKPGGLSNEWGANAGNFFAASAPMDVLGAKTKKTLTTKTAAQLTPSITAEPTTVSPTIIPVQKEDYSFFGKILKFVKSLLGIE
jgi:hypothetical protein